MNTDEPTGGGPTWVSDVPLSWYSVFVSGCRMGPGRKEEGRDKGYEEE